MRKTFRRTISFLLVFLLVSSLITSFAFADDAMSYTDKYGTWEYVVEEDGSITLTGFTNLKKNVKVPSEIDGKPVHKLGDGLFEGNDGLTMIVIPDGITEIGDNVFKDCDLLEKVTLPYTLTSIGAGAFAECDKISSLSIPNGVKSIGDGAFANCASLGIVTIPDSVENLGEGLFIGSPNVEVHCNADSNAAAYLKEHKGEVAKFKIYETEKVDTSWNVSDSSQLNGPLVTYSFGKLINGQREFTIVLCDSMPDFNISDYVDKSQYGYLAFKSDAFEEFHKRFSVISATQYNGSDFINLIEDYDEDDLPYCSFWPSFTSDADGNITDVKYFLDLYFDENNGYQLTTCRLDSSYNLTSYVEADCDNNYVITKNPYSYAEITRNDDDTITKSADGEVIKTNNLFYNYAYVFPFGQKGYDSITYYVNKDGDSAGNITKYTSTRASIHTDDSNSISANYHVYYNSEGLTTYISSYYEEIKDEKEIAYDSQHISTTPATDSSYSSYSSAMPITSGIYEIKSASLNIDNDDTPYTSTTHYTDQDGKEMNLRHEYSSTGISFYYNDYVVKGNDVSEAQDNLHTDFPNEADERTERVSEVSISDTIHSEYTSTDTDLNTGKVSTYSSQSKSETIKDHTYIGGTGKYVGWDWYWNYSKYDQAIQQTVIVDNVQTYTVTEYSYDSSTDTWTKTVVSTSAKNGGEEGVDFKSEDTMPTDLLANYSVSSTEYVYDESTAAGVDNWRMSEYYFALDAKETEDDKDVVRENSDYTIVDSSTGINVSITTDADTGEVISENCVTRDSEGFRESTPEEKALVDEKKDETIDIIMGTSTVTDGSGNEVSQAEEKQEMLDLEETVLEELQNPEPESYVEEVLEQIPDGETTLAEMQATELPPETTDPVTVEYTEDGPVLTEAESTEAA